jgi:hypothetical protein
MNLRRRIAGGTRTQVSDFQRVRPPKGMMAASKRLRHVPNEQLKV